MKRLPPIVALTCGAVMVVGAIFGLAALFFEPPVDTGAVTESLGEVVDGAPGVTVPSGGVLQISGDRQDFLTFDGHELEFGGPVDPSFATTVEGEVVSLSWETDPAGGAVFLRHFLLDGLDFFLDPGACRLTPGEIGSAGIVPVEVECIGVTDVRDTVTISLSGQVEFPFTRFPPPGISTGGEVVVGGDIEATLAIDEVNWVTQPPDDLPPETAVPELDASKYSDITGFSLTLGRRPGGGLSVLYFYYHDTASGFFPPYFELPAGKCPAAEELLKATGPDTAMYRVTFDCATLHSAQIEGDESKTLTISLRGELTAHRLDLSDG